MRDEYLYQLTDDVAHAAYLSNKASERAADLFGLALEALEDASANAGKCLELSEQLQRAVTRVIAEAGQ